MSKNRLIKPASIFTAIALAGVLAERNSFSQTKAPESCQKVFYEPVNSIKELEEFARRFSFTLDVRDSLSKMYRLRNQAEQAAKLSIKAQDLALADDPADSTQSSEAQTGVTKVKTVTPIEADSAIAGIHYSLIDYKDLQKMTTALVSPSDELVRAIGMSPVVMSYEGFYDEGLWKGKIRVNAAPASSLEILHQKGYLALHFLTATETLMEPLPIAMAREIQKQGDLLAESSQLSKTFEFCKYRTYQKRLKMRLERMLNWNMSDRCSKDYVLYLALDGGLPFELKSDLGGSSYKFELSSDDQALKDFGFNLKQLGKTGKKALLAKCPKVTL